MFVCVCHAVSDRTIDRTIDAHGPCPDTVGFETGAGTRCGSCRPWIENRCAERQGLAALPTVPLSAARRVMYGRALPAEQEAVPAAVDPVTVRTRENVPQASLPLDGTDRLDHRLAIPLDAMRCA